MGKVGVVGYRCVVRARAHPVFCVPYIADIITDKYIAPPRPVCLSDI
jgi:hypothetical protein